MCKLQNSVIAAVLLWSTTAFSYEPPTGVPDPGLGWGDLHPVEATAPPRPANWSAPVDGFYYVDPSASGATDSGNTYGYPGEPRSSIPSNVPAGSYVELHGDFSNQKKTVTYNCTQQQPCWLRGQNKDNMPIMSGRLGVKDASYLFVEYINFDGGIANAFNITGDSHHVVFRNSRVTNRAQPNGASSGVSIIPDKGDRIENIVVYNNHIENLGDWTITVDLDFHGIVPSLWGRDSTSELRKVWILDNYGCNPIF